MIETAVARWRPMITALLETHWRGTDPLRILAQVQVESSGDPGAVSSHGARGLMQLMPDTAAELGVTVPHDPEQNLRGGIVYLKRQFDHFPEIPDETEKWRWAWASYNVGRGFTNRAISLARLDGEPYWWRWNPGRFWMFHRQCVVGGKVADYRQVFDYVAKIEAAIRD